jgi:hypothetical protein
MAYDFDGVNQSIDASSAVLTAVPVTLACWSNVDAVTARYAVLSVSSSGTGLDHFVLLMSGEFAGDPVSMFTQTGFPSSGGYASSSTGFSASTWTHAAGASSANNNRAAYINGGSKSTNTNSATPVGLNVTSIGRLWRTGSSNAYTDGRIAEAAIWDAALTDAEIASLAKGFKPYRVRPQNLIFYVPLVRNIADLRKGVALTNNNSATVANHPRVY